MEIHFAVPEDVPGIIELLKQAGQVHREGRPDIFRAGAQKYGPSQVLAMLDKPDTPVFVAAEGGKVLGYCFCQMKTYYRDPVIADHTTCYIDDLCVEESNRGRGIGTALYETVCKYARQRQCYSITLNVWSCNAGAVKFFEKLDLKPQMLCMQTLLEKNEC